MLRGYLRRSFASFQFWNTNVEQPVLARATGAGLDLGFYQRLQIHRKSVRVCTQLEAEVFIFGQRAKDQTSSGFSFLQADLTAAALLLSDPVV